jgi:hypothetical protein
MKNSIMIILILWCSWGMQKSLSLFLNNNISIYVSIFFMAQCIIEGIAIFYCYYLIKDIEIHTKNTNDFIFKNSLLLKKRNEE